MRLRNLYLFVLVLIVLAAILPTYIQASTEQQIVIGDDRPPSIKEIIKGGSVGECDLYIVTIDIPNNFDTYQIVTVCGENREIAH